MNMRIERIIVSFLLAGAAASAPAQPAGYRRGAHEPVSVSYLKEGGPQRMPQVAGQPLQFQERGPGREFALPDTGGYDSEAGRGEGRRPGRMSVEQRRILRQQIDEAGHDLYSRGR